MDFRENFLSPVVGHSLFKALIEACYGAFSDGMEWTSFSNRGNEN